MNVAYKSCQVSSFKIWLLYVLLFPIFDPDQKESVPNRSLHTRSLAWQIQKIDDDRAGENAVTSPEKTLSTTRLNYTGKRDIAISTSHGKLPLPSLSSGHVWA